MKNVLHIISSARGNLSYSKGLSSAIVERLTDMNLGSMVVERDLTHNFPPFISQAGIKEFYKHPDAIDDAGQLQLQFSNTVLKEIKEADIIVMGTPRHNLGIAAPLKAWIDQLIRFGITYGYDNDGKRKGYLENKKVYLAIASGGKLSDWNSENEYIESYIKSVFQAYTGITDISTYRIEGTANPHFKENYEEIIKNLS